MLGLSFAFVSSYALAQIFINETEQTIEKTTDYQDIYSQKFATTTFNSLAEYEKAKRDFNFERELFNRLDRIIWLLEKQ